MCSLSAPCVLLAGRLKCEFFKHCPNFLSSSYILLTPILHHPRPFCCGTARRTEVAGLSWLSPSACLPCSLVPLKRVAEQVSSSAVGWSPSGSSTRWDATGWHTHGPSTAWRSSNGSGTRWDTTRGLSHRPGLSHGLSHGPWLALWLSHWSWLSLWLAHGPRLSHWLTHGPGLTLWLSHWSWLASASKDKRYESHQK